MYNIQMRQKNDLTFIITVNALKGNKQKVFTFSDNSKMLFFIEQLVARSETYRISTSPLTGKLLINCKCEIISE